MTAAVTTPPARNSSTLVISSVRKTWEKLTLSYQSFSVHSWAPTVTMMMTAATMTRVGTRARERRPPGMRPPGRDPRPRGPSEPSPPSPPLPLPGPNQSRCVTNTPDLAGGRASGHVLCGPTYRVGGWFPTGTLRAAA